MGGGVGVGAVQAGNIYIYIYNSETPSWVHGSDEEPGEE